MPTHSPHARVNTSLIFAVEMLQLPHTNVSARMAVTWIEEGLIAVCTALDDLCDK